MIRAQTILCIAATLATAGTAAAQEGPEGGAYSYYVALGDSFSSGVGTSTMNEDACLTSQMAWPYRVEADIGNPTFVTAACSGATTQDIMAQGPKIKAQGQPQIELLPPAEELDGALITIQVGGNDLGYESECLAGPKKGDGTNGPIPKECKDLEYKYNNAQETVAAMAPALDYIYRALRERAPNATIVAVGYPHLVSTTNPACDQSAVGFFLDLDARQKLNALIDAGNAQIKASAANAGIAAITDEIATKFEGHEACSTDEWIVSPEAATSLVQIGHPNDLGAQGIAEVVLSLLPSVTTRNGTVMPEESDDPSSDGGDRGAADGGNDEEPEDDEP